MRIVHIAPNAPYNEGWGYQENLLPKYQAKAGHAVTLIITNQEHRDGTLQQVPETRYLSENGGFEVIRKQEILPPVPKIKHLFTKLDVYDLLVELKPDLIFYHGLVSMTIFQVVKYKKNVDPKVIIVQDNHFDYNIGFKPDKSIRDRIYAKLYRSVYSRTDSYISKVYGVTPWRSTYAQEVFGVPSSKADVLIMGADDEKLHLENREKIRETVRARYNIGAEDFLIVTGGKIDRRKKIDLLMKACGEMGGNIKLLVFGQVADDVKAEFDALVQAHSNILSIGWINADSVYDYFFAADLVFFPGQHSVLWEQACASKVPCVFEKWTGMDHVDNGGNSAFISPVTMENIQKIITELHFTPKYFAMKQVAQSQATDVYLYSKIAEKSVEAVE